VSSLSQLDELLLLLLLKSDASICRSNGMECLSRESFSSDSDMDDLLLQHQHRWHRRRATPAIDKIRTIESLSTDSLDPDSVHEQHGALGGADSCRGPQRRLSRPRDRVMHRRSYSPLLDSSERSHYSASNPYGINLIHGFVYHQFDV